MHKINTHTHTQRQPLRDLPQGIEWKWKPSKGDVRGKKEKKRGRRKAHVAEGDSHLHWNQLIPPSLPPLLRLSFSHPSFCLLSLPVLCLPVSPPSSDLYLSSTNLLSISLTTSLSLHFLLALPFPSHSSSLYSSISLGFHSFVLSLSLYSTALFLSLSQWESCRQTEAAYTNVTIFDKTHTHTHTHTHIFSCHMHDCTNIRKRRRGGGGTHTHTQTCRHTGKTALKCTCVDKQTHTRAHTHTNTLRRVLSAGITNIATHTQKG